MQGYGIHIKTEMNSTPSLIHSSSNYRKCLHMSYDNIVSSYVSNARKPICTPWSSIPESFQFKCHKHLHTPVRQYLRIKNQT